MNFKLTIISTILIGCLSVTGLNSCKSPPEKTDDAFERVKEEKKLTNDSSIINDAMVLEKNKSSFQTKKTTQDDRTQYKIETIKKIQSNKTNIREIKALPNKNAGTTKKVEDLEKDNNDLIIEMSEYNKKEKVKWELFKAGMNENVNEIGIKLEAIKNNQ